MNIKEQHGKLYNDVKTKYINIPQAKQLEYLKKYKKTKDVKYLHLIINANLRLIMDVACSFNRHGGNDMILLDLISIGNEEAIKCLDRYQFDKGWCSVSSWIRNNIRLKMIMFLKEHSNVVKINSSAYDQIRRDKQYRNMFFLENGYFPHTGECIVNGEEEYVFKDEYVFSTTAGFESEDGESFFEKIIDDSNVEKTDINSNAHIIKKKINDIAKKILSRREYQIIDCHYNNGIRLTDVNKYLSPESEHEVKSIFRTGKNRLVLYLNDVKYKYNLYSSFVFKDNYSNQISKGKEYQLDAPLDNEVIIIKGDKLELSFSNNMNTKITLNGITIQPIEENSKNKKYEIFINKKIGVPVSKMYTYNVHDVAIKKLRAFILSKKINIYE